VGGGVDEQNGKYYSEKEGNSDTAAKMNDTRRHCPK
jgi:hypothetical protein